MGLGGINIWQLLIILVIVLLLFGTKRLRGLGGDLGGAIKGFKKAIKEDTSEETKASDEDTAVEAEKREEAPKSADTQHQKSESKQ